MYRYVAIVLLLVTGLTAASVVHADEFKLLMWIEGISGPEGQAENWIEANNALHHIPDLPPLLQLMNNFPTELSIDYRPSPDAEMHIDDIVLTKEVDKSTPKLLHLCRSGAVIPRMRLALVSPTSKQAIGMNFEEIKVTYMAVHAPGFGDRAGVTPIALNEPIEEIGIHFRSMTASIEP